MTILTARIARWAISPSQARLSQAIIVRGVTEDSQAFHIPVLFHRACPCAVLWRDDIFDHLVQECRYVRVLACGFALCLLPPVLTSTLLSRVEGNGSRPLSVAQLQV